MKKVRFKIWVIVPILLFLNGNCLVVIHESKSRIPIENGYDFRCGKKSKYENRKDCIDAYIARRLAQRENYIQVQEGNRQE